VTDVDTAVEQAAAQLAAEPHGDLPVGSRQIVWAALGPRGGDPGPGWRRRAELAIATCEHVLPLWEEDRPGDTQPHAVLALARAALDDAAVREEARAQAGRLWARTDNITQLSGDPARAMVGYACAKAVDVVLYDENFDPDDLDPERIEEFPLPSNVDTAYMAAAAVSGGLPGQEGTDVEARREFWRWWLSEAARL
jgi:immunity protein Imm5 of predicted polymorphic toxin system